MTSDFSNYQILYDFRTTLMADARQVLFGAWTTYTYIFGQSELAKKYNGSTGKVK
jgi:hypothetical protein